MAYAVPHRLHDRARDVATGQDAPVDLAQSELGVVRGDREIAGDERCERAAEAPAVHHRDRRLEGSGRRPRPCDAQLALRLSERIIVRPRKYWRGLRGLTARVISMLVLSVSRR